MFYTINMSNENLRYLNVSFDSETERNRASQTLKKYGESKDHDVEIERHQGTTRILRGEDVDELVHELANRVDKSKIDFYKMEAAEADLPDYEQHTLNYNFSASPEDTRSHLEVFYNKWRDEDGEDEEFFIDVTRKGIIRSSFNVSEAEDGGSQVELVVEYAGDLENKLEGYKEELEQIGKLLEE